MLYLRREPENLIEPENKDELKVKLLKCAEKDLDMQGTQKSSEETGKSAKCILGREEIP